MAINDFKQHSNLENNKHLFTNYQRNAFSYIIEFVPSHGGCIYFAGIFCIYYTNKHIIPVSNVKYRITQNTQPFIRHKIIQQPATLGVLHISQDYSQ